MNNQQDLQQKNVAVIGAGAAGLVTARELLRQGFSVAVFEQAEQLGGLWVYSEATESDILGQAVERRIHSSLYQSLRTNLPRDLMAFSDYSFDCAGGGDDSWPRFPHHSQVRHYIDNFARDHQLLEHITFNTTVKQLTRDTDTGTVTLELQCQKTNSTSQQHFDAVAVCNGHFAKPRVPVLDALHRFPGKALHSHNYRRPEDFSGQRVAVFGVAASGADIAREIASQADQVFWCGETFDALAGKQKTDPAANNMQLYSCPTGFDSDGKLYFKHNAAEKIDSFVYATGYHYDYPFLDDSLQITVEDNYVSPLYQQIVPPHCPNIGFIGIPFVVVPFPFFEIQARWFARSIAAPTMLPTTAQMQQWLTHREATFQTEQRKQRQYHQLAGEHNSYLNTLLQQLDAEPLPDWFTALLDEVKQTGSRNPASFRDQPYSQQGPTVLRRE
ncbi:MAG: thioredoxin reductase [Paraglaciecola psychrophila]|jgi:thioredoxin reductase